MTALRYHAVVIEDDPQIRRFLRTVLPDEGFEVFEAETGERGLIEAATRKPDVVILDLGLPDLDGTEVIRRLREWSQVPILVLSARDARAGQDRRARRRRGRLSRRSRSASAS